jgi:hypothetical protein
MSPATLVPSTFQTVSFVHHTQAEIAHGLGLFLCRSGKAWTHCVPAVSMGSGEHTCRSPCANNNSEPVTQERQFAQLVLISSICTVSKAFVRQVHFVMPFPCCLTEYPASLCASFRCWPNSQVPLGSHGITMRLQWALWTRTMPNRTMILFEYLSEWCPILFAFLLSCGIAFINHDDKIPP